MENFMKEIKDKGLEKALNELAKRKAVKVEDAVRLALVGAAKEISLSRA